MRFNLRVRNRLNNTKQRGLGDGLVVDFLTTVQEC